MKSPIMKRYQKVRQSFKKLVQIKHQATKMA